MAEVNFLVKKGLTVPKGSASTPAIIFDASDPNTGIYSPAADQVAISTNGTGRLFVDASGRVGLGTASPAGPFHIVGSGATSVIIDRTDAAPGVAFRFNGATNAQILTDTDGSISINSDPTNALASSYIRAMVDGSERLRITSDGKLGLGTSSPGSLLSLYAGVNSEYFRGGGNGVTTRDLVISASTGTNAGDTHTINSSGASGQLIFSTASTLRMLIDSSGRVGIGTTSPVSDAKLTLVDSPDDNPAIAFQRVGTNREDGAIQFTAGAFVFKNGANSGTVAGLSERVRIDPDGRLLVGTSSAVSDEKLKVQGSAYFGSGPNTVTLANGATGTVITPPLGYSYINISFDQSTTGGLLVLVFASTSTLTVVSTVNDRSGATYSVAASGRNLQVTNSTGTTATFYASCMSLLRANG